jgi:hypothetical protein
MQRTIIAGLFAFVVAVPVACRRDAKPSADTAVVANAGDTVDSSSAEEARLIQASAGRVRRNAHTLEIIAKSGPVALVDDTSDGENYKVYRYVGHLGDAPFHVVHISFYEAQAFELVHDGTGRRFRVDSLPVVSPDRVRFVTTSSDLEAANDPTRIAIYRFVADSADVEWQLEPEGWGPAEARWRGADTVAFRKLYPPSSPDSAKQDSALVVRSPNGWKLVEL